MTHSRTLRGRSLALLPAHLLAWLYAAVLVIPLYFLLVSAFKTNTDIFIHPFSLPRSLGFERFSQAISRAQLGTALVNSALITVVAEVITLVLSIPAAYGLARSDGRLSAWIERTFAAGFLVPAFAALVSTVVLSIKLDLFQTRLFLMLFYPAGALPLSIILLTQFMRTIPAELEESAMVDGASRLVVLLRIYLPLTIPGIATVAILNFLAFWNEYLFALVITGAEPSVRTVQVALPSLVSETNTEYGILTAGTVITLLPVYLVYIVMHRRMEAALLQGAVKA